MHGQDPISSDFIATGCWHLQLTLREAVLPRQPAAKGAQQTSPDITAPVLSGFTKSNKGPLSFSYSREALE